jgi:hypothetical protein
MKKVFKDFATYIRLHDGHNKPRIDWQNMYKLFPNFEFIAGRDFGQYQNFGQAFEHKNYDMTVRDESGNECQMIYREYYDVNENLAYCQ